jgi:Peptidase family M28
MTADTYPVKSQRASRQNGNTLADEANATAPTDRTAGWPAALSLVVLGLLVVLGIWSKQPPAPVPSSAAPEVFSAERAMKHLPEIASVPHPIGSQANAQTRAYVVKTLESLGWETQRQVELGMSQEDGAVGFISNVVARLRGTGDGKAVMLVAHYDSVPTGPGAADDGAAVAALLETARALKTLPRLRNDVIVLLTDGEEAGLLGAEAFVARHPWVPDVAAVLNFEYRGNSGPSIMFETSPGHGRLIDAFASTPLPVGTSLMYEIYRVMPNQTDMSVFKRVGIPGLNFAAISNASTYHSELDRVEDVDGRSVQHQGETMLALSRRLGEVDLGTQGAPDQVYFDLPGLGLLHYPVSLAWGPAGLACVLWIAALSVGMRKGQVRVGRMAVGLVALPCTALLLALAGTLGLLLIRSFHPEYRGLVELYNHLWYWGALLALTLAWFLGIYGWLQRRFNTMELSLGAALVWLVLVLLGTARFPGASYALAWPLAGVLAAWLVVLVGAGRISGLQRVMVLTVGAIPAALLFAPLVHTLLVALTTPMAGAAMIAVVFLLALLWPLLAAVPRRGLVIRAAVVIGVAMMAGGEFSSGVSAERPRPVNVFYVQDGGSNTAQWLSSDVVLGDWQRHFFDAGAVRRSIPEWFGEASRRYWTSAAPDVGLPAPDLKTLSDRTEGGTRTVELQLRSRREARDFKLQVIGARVSQAMVQGRPVPPATADDWSLAAHNLPPEGLTIQLVVTAGRPFTVHLFDVTPGLPMADGMPRDATHMAHRAESSNTTQSLTTQRFQ